MQVQNYHIGCIKKLPKRYAAKMHNMLQHYRELKGLTQAQLADLAGTSAPQIQRLENGERKFTVEWAERIAPHLGVHPANLVFDLSDLVAAKQTGENEAVSVDVEFEYVPVVGEVEAGKYRPSSVWHESDQYHLALPVDDRYPGIKRFCLRVVGNSMDQIFPPNTLVICVNMIQIQGEARSGDIYVVDYTNVYGEVESTLKELQITDTGEWLLYPRSNDPAHQKPIKLNGNNGDEIRLRAKVIGDYSTR